MSGMGHNNGPSMEPGQGFRRYAWGKARRDLLPQLPLNVIRRRVARAKEIGLDYHTYATVRATSGRDIIGFLFSSNALRLHLASGRMPADRAAQLRDMACDRTALLHPPHHGLAPGEPLDAAHPAPAPFALWRDQRAGVLSVLNDRGLPADGVVLIGDVAFEREWAGAARLAAYLPQDRFFVGDNGTARGL
ncbi:hypothetical protein [Oceaniglobus trochenteri]|uniref:hypothetical protein n=1 Tax=Oceaniglobus trochenteri TaxID=2763260 RepID=UPI001CFF6F5D|nr:hypothetical protein [Oceaniglobus trochenteri]